MEGGVAMKRGFLSFWLMVMFSALADGRVWALPVQQKPDWQVQVERMGLTGALHQAAESGQEESVITLLEHGAKVDARSKNGWTPLMGAVALRHLEVVKLLVARGAKINARDRRGN